MELRGLRGLLLFAVCASELAAAGCAGSAGRCGTGAVLGDVARMRRRARGAGPYCLVISAEGVGTLNLDLNQGGAGGGGGEGGGSSGGGLASLPVNPGAPVSYTMAPTAPTWVDICNAPGSRRVLPMVDDREEQAWGAIPFAVRVWDQPVQPPFTISSNGWMSFVPGANGSLSGTVPARDTPNLTVAGFWRDLYTRASGICYGVTGAAPNRRFVVQWQDLHFCCSDDPAVHLTFEVVVHEARPPRQNNVIDVVYQQMDGAVGQTGGAGIENADGSNGVPIPGPFTGQRAFRFTPSR